MKVSFRSFVRAHMLCLATVFKLKGVDSTTLPAMYYPDWDAQRTCVNDGEQPSWMSLEGYGPYYLFQTGTECCTVWFPTATNCPRNIAPATSPAAPSLNIYYPEYSHRTCVADGNEPEYMSLPGYGKYYLFPTGEDCCMRHFPMETNCPADPQMLSDVAGIFYPDFYGAGTCNGDLQYPSWMAIAGFSEYYLMSAQACCQMWYPNNINCPTNSNGVTSTPGGDVPYVEGTVYKGGDVITHGGKFYVCKPYPYEGWCTIGGWAYTPGTGTYWTQAWDLIENPSAQPSSQPSISGSPSSMPSDQPSISGAPSSSPSDQPSISSEPSSAPSNDPSGSPSSMPSISSEPSNQPSMSGVPSSMPSISAVPSEQPSISAVPSELPSISAVPSEQPSVSTVPSELPSVSAVPSELPSISAAPSSQPSLSASPSDTPSVSGSPSLSPSVSAAPSSQPSASAEPSNQPSLSGGPSSLPSASNQPSGVPSCRISDSLVHLYRGEGSVVDCVGNTNGVLGTTTGFSADGIHGRAFDFNALQSSEVNPLGANIDQSNYPYMTMGMWINLRSKPNNRGWVITNENGGFDRALVLHDSRFGGNVAAGVGYTYTSTLPSITLNEWHCVAVAYNNDARTAMVYYDGVVQTVATNLFPGHNFASLGGHTFAGGHTVNGLVDEVFIADSVLTQNEISQICTEVRECAC